MIVNHNLIAANTFNKMSKHEKASAEVTQKLSSGLRINKAADDAAGMAISQKLKAQIRGLGQAERNIQDGVSLLQTADSGLEQIENPTLQRMRELAVQAANGTLTTEDRQAIQTEMDQLKQGINDLANNTHFNGNSLLNASGKELNIQVGANPSDVFKIELTDARAEALGIDAIKVDPQEEAVKAIAKLDVAFEKVSTERTKFGAYQNGLEHQLSNASNMEFNLTAANSRIEDADVAFESMELAKNNILYQASQAIMAQANSQPNSVLQLLKQ